MMAGVKGPRLEEVVRSFFSQQGYFALRSVPYRFSGDDVTDVDVWLYSRQAPSLRMTGIVDVKNKKSPRAYERILWTKGLQAALKADKAMVATTDGNPSVTALAKELGVTLIPRSFLERSEDSGALSSRLTLEDIVKQIETNRSHREDGNWIGVLADAKATLASIGGFPAFNRATAAFRFFAERAEVRVMHADIALRCALQGAAIACIALDMALARLSFDDRRARYNAIVDGINFGDTGDGRTKQALENAFSVIGETTQNGKAIAAQARAHLKHQLKSIRADLIAEYFMRESNAMQLFDAARELDEAAHTTAPPETNGLTVAARSIIGVLCDFVGMDRSLLQSDEVSRKDRASKTSAESQGDLPLTLEKSGPANTPSG
jgi:hypothetical protein